MRSRRLSNRLGSRTRSRRLTKSRRLGRNKSRRIRSRRTRRSRRSRRSLRVGGFVRDGSVQNFHRGHN